MLHDEIFDWHWGDLVAPMPENSEGGCIQLQPPFFCARSARIPCPKRQRGGTTMAPWLPNIGDTLNSRPFPPRAVVLMQGRFVVPLADASG